VDTLTRIKTIRAAWPAAAPVVAAVAVAVGAAIAAGSGNAAPPMNTDEARYPTKNVKLEHASRRLRVLTVVGTRASDNISLRLRAGDPGILEVDLGGDGSADSSVERGEIAAIVVDARAGDDLVRIDESNGVFTTSIPTALAGAGGNDRLAGGSGAEALLGGGGNDAVDGNGARDLALLGAGDDTFVWDPGDGSDVVEGQVGHDLMRFNGAAGAERVDLSANRKRLKLFRDAGNITMDTDGVEQVEVNAVGGADQVTVNDLTGTDVGSVNVGLAGTAGGVTSDGQLDRVIVNRTERSDAVDVDGDAAGVSVSGLPTLVTIKHQDATDQLTVNGLAGADTISAAALAAGAIALTLDGGAGGDTMAGARGVEALQGGDGNDSLDGNGGADVALMGSGDDTFIWDPGDASDVVEGQEGDDTMRFNGAGVGEQVDLSANGSRLRFFRAPGNITMDTAGVEIIDLIALGGADQVTVNDLEQTAVTSVNLDLGVGGTGDGQADRIVVNGTDGDDTIAVAGDAAGVKVGGLAATVSILHPEAANDRLDVNTLGGTDAVETGELTAGALQLFVDGALVP
jgi:Ca2+-binding RTX toxin-like protein